MPSPRAGIGLPSRPCKRACAGSWAVRIPEPSVRVVLGHFVFVYIHPYSDGNGRIGRFLMNVMLAAAGYPWTIVPLPRRNAYMAALEDASVRQDIVPFSELLAQLVNNQVGRDL